MRYERFNKYIPSFFCEFAFNSNVFIKIHEYSNYISLATKYKVRLAMSEHYYDVKFGTLRATIK